MMVRVRRQIAIGQVDAAAVDEIAPAANGDKYCRVALLGDAYRRGSLGSHCCDGNPMPGEDGTSMRACPRIARSFP